MIVRARSSRPLGRCLLGEARGALERPADELLQNFIASGVDALHAAVRPHAGDRVFCHIAVAAMQLQALVDDAALAFRQPVLGHGGGHRVELAGDKSRDAIVDEHAANLRLRLALRQLEARILKFNERLAERLALFRVLDGEGHGAFRGATAPTPVIKPSSRNCSLIWEKPAPPAVPRRFPEGTRTSSKKSSQVSTSCMPTFSSELPTRYPARSLVSATIMERPRKPAALGSVFAATQTRLACEPLVMKVFEPFRR